ncbi:hypothetical protein [Uliginosibacterium flavum]|uniref:Uncharacterized protein n=1 Tax=Uliginosibacterium flavum TaxID=1396831 RepID=A0ABV2TPL7_9RHOO
MDIASLPEKLIGVMASAMRADASDQCCSAGGLEVGVGSLV